MSRTTPPSGINYMLGGKIAIRWSERKGKIYVAGGSRYLADMRVIMKRYLRFWHWEESKMCGFKWILKSKGNHIRLQNAVERMNKDNLFPEVVRYIGKGTLWW